MNFIFLLGVQKNEYSFGNENFVDIFSGVITKFDYIEGSFICIVGSLLKVKVQNGGYFFEVGKISNIFWGS